MNTDITTYINTHIDTDKNSAVISRNRYIIGAACLFFALAAVAFLFQWSGIRAVIGMGIMFILPAFMLLNISNDLSLDEKLFFSFFLGIGLFPLFVWYANRLIPSLKISLFFSVLALAVAGSLLNSLLKRASRRQSPAQPAKEEEHTHGHSHPGQAGQHNN